MFGLLHKTKLWIPFIKNSQLHWIFDMISAIIHNLQKQIFSDCLRGGLIYPFLYACTWRSSILNVLAD